MKSRQTTELLLYKDSLRLGCAGRIHLAKDNQKWKISSAAML